MSTEIEKIILEHSFSELSAEQISQVRDWADTEEEYNTLRRILTTAPILHAELSPNPALKASLMETFAAKHKAGIEKPSSSQVNNATNQRKIRTLWLGRIGAVAAVILVLFMVYPLLNKTDDYSASTNNSNKSIVPQKRDTTVKKNDSAPSTAEWRENIVESKERMARVESNPSETIRAHAKDVILTENQQETLTPARLNLNKMSTESKFSRAEMADVVLEEAYGSLVEPNSRAELTRSTHSDRLSASDLPEESRQVVHQQPEILDWLHTTF